MSGVNVSLTSAIRRGEGIGSGAVGRGQRRSSGMGAGPFVIEGTRPGGAGGKSRRKSGHPPTPTRFPPGTFGVWLSDFLA